MTSLTAKQQVSISESEDFATSIWSGAVRSGKSIGAMVAFLIGIAKAPEQGEIVIVGRTLQTIERNILSPMMDPVLFGSAARQVFHTKGASVAVILGRTVHLIGASDARAETKIRGMTICLSMVDEATLVSEEFWNQLQARHSVPGARCLATTNPDSRSHWLKREWIDETETKDIGHWHFVIDDNPTLDPEYVERIKANYSGLWYRRFILGEWVQAEGAIYDMWDEDVHVVDELPEMVDVLSVGVDYGTASVFAAVMLGLGRDGRLYVMKEYRHEAKKVQRQLTDIEYAQRLSDWMGDIRPKFLVIDPSATSFIQQMVYSKYSSQKAKNDVADGIRLVSSLLTTDRLRVHRSCVGLLEEFPSYVWDDKAQKIGEDKPVKADDHSLDALRYAVFTTEGYWTHRLKPVG